MDLISIFISSSFDRSDGEVAKHIEKLRRNLKLLDDMMLAAPDFIAALGNLGNDHQHTRLQGYFALLWLHSMAVRDSLLIVRENKTRLWNAPALAVHARALQECFVGFFYFCAEEVDASQKHMRELLWFRQCFFKKTQLAKEIPDKDIPEGIRVSLVKDASGLEDCDRRLRACSEIKKIEKSNPGLAKNILKKQDLIFAEDQGVIWSRAGFEDGQFRKSWILLSQNVHSTPFAVNQILTFKADTDDSAASISLPVIVALWSFSKAVRETTRIVPSLETSARRILEIADEFRR